MATVIENLRKLLDTPRDGALLRFSLGTEYFKVQDYARAIESFKQSLDRDPAYSAAWRSLGKAYEATQRPEEALAAFRRGIAVAQGKGDKQAEKEMTVFARRLERKAAG